MVELKNVIDSTQLVIDKNNEKLKIKCMQEIENAQPLIDAANEKVKYISDKIKK